MEEINFCRLEGGREMYTQKWKVIPRINTAAKLVGIKKLGPWSTEKNSAQAVLCEQSITSDQSLTEIALQTLTASTVILVLSLNLISFFLKNLPVPP